MTTEDDIEEDGIVDTNNVKPTPDLPQEIMNIIEFLSSNPKIIFKSQQRDEPELQPTEKVKVALDVYQRNPQTFLIRYGNYLEDKHLQDFAKLSVADSDEEMHLMVKEYQNKIKTRQQDVKNRRYAALQKLIKEGEYFSEQEMMKRQPELYQELVGQYLSETEKKQRDSYDVKNTTFSGILMHNLVQNQISEIMEKAVENVKQQKQDLQIHESSSEDSIVENISSDNLETEEVPLNCRQQWGNFDNEQIACSSSKIKPRKALVKPKIKYTQASELITADERELFRQEFTSQMHEQFLTGQDQDFDYATVDDNTQFDDLQIINQDKEDKYFEETDDEGDDNHIENFTHKMNENEESEDELDVYMSHLNKHHSLQKITNN